MYSQKGRRITMFITLSACIILRLPTFWAITVYEYPDCPDFFRTKTASTAEWVMESLIYHVYDFHLLSIAQTVFPFIVLLTFNIIIVKRLYTMKIDGTTKSPSTIPLNSESQVFEVQIVNNHGQNHEKQKKQGSAEMVEHLIHDKNMPKMLVDMPKIEMDEKQLVFQARLKTAKNKEVETFWKKLFEFEEDHIDNKTEKGHQISETSLTSGPRFS
uniref:G-protein coupled receptors family 1 profile domain-containing protein n=1 Tax=Panagrolaimus sp. JU765 TaxID=591449 RepID=A0AC34PX30_9BILA